MRHYGILGVTFVPNFLDMNKDTINSYLINLRRFITPFLKADVSLKLIAYPFEDGAVIVGDFSINGNNNTESRSESQSFTEAITKTNLFDEPELMQPIDNTKIVIGTNKFVVIKGSNAGWSDKDAETDVKKIVDALPKG